MKKLFKLGLLSLLMGSLVATSGCYKKDIDDLEERLNDLETRVTSNAQAIAVLQGVVDGDGLVTNVEANSTIGELKLKISYANGDTETITIPYTPPTPPVTPPVDLPDPAAIVRSFANADPNFYEIQVWAAEGSQDYYVIRIGKSNPASEVIVRSRAVEITVGKPGYAVLDINPSGYELTKALIGFNSVTAPSRAEGLQDGIAVKEVYRASTFSTENAEAWAAIADRFLQADGLVADPLEGRWIIEFETTAEIEDPLQYTVKVMFPKAAGASNGIWKNGVGMPEASTATQYVISEDVITFADQIPVFSLGNTDPEDDTAITLATTEETPAEEAAMNSDGTVAAAISIVNYDGDPNAYLADPTITVDVDLTDADDQTLSPDATTVDALKSYLEATFAEEAGTDPVWKNLTFSMIDDADMDAGIFAAGTKAVYTITYTAIDSATEEITTNEFVLTVTRVRETFDITPVIDAMYIPVNAFAVEYGSLVAPEENAEPDPLYNALHEMGYTDAQILAATFDGLTLEKFDAAADAYAPFTDATPAAFAVTTPAAEADMTLTINTNVLPGKYRLTYNFTVNGKNAEIRDVVEIVAPTVYVKLAELVAVATEDAEVLEVFDATTPDVTSVRAYRNVAGGVNVASVLNLDVIKIGRTYDVLKADGTEFTDEPANVYEYDATADATLLSSTYGLRAEAAVVPFGAEDAATKVKLTVKLATGQILPVVVNETNDYAPGSDKATNQTVADWTNGDFYVTAVANTIRELTLKTDYSFDLNTIISTPADISDLIESVELMDGRTIIANADYEVTDGTNTGAVSMNVYQQLMKDARFTVEVAIDAITGDPIIPENSRLLVGNEANLIVSEPKTEAVTGATPAEFDYTRDFIYAKGKAGYVAWDATKNQPVTVTVTDALTGAPKITTTNIAVSHSGVTP